MYGRAGGAENHTYDLAAAFERGGHACIVVYGGAGLDLYHVEGRPEHHIAGLTSKALLPAGTAARALRAVLEKERPDVAYVHTSMEPGTAALLARALPVVFFAHTHDLYCPAGSKHLQRSDRVCPHAAGPVCFVQAFLERCQPRRPGSLARNFVQMRRMQEWARNVEVLQVDSRDMRERLVAAGYHSDRIAVLPTAVRIPAEPPAGGPGPRPGPRVLFAGRLTPQKGLRYLLEAARISRIHYRLIVAGEGPDVGSSRALAKRLGVAARVDFVGWRSREQMDLLYGACDLVVVPSVWPEPFGMVGPEAMGHAKPVVAFDVGGIPDWLEDGVTGFLVSPRDVRALSDHIDRLLEERDLGRRMGEAGRARALRLYGQDGHVRTLVELLERAIRERSAAGGRSAA
jgi:glycosyltransferase involved in cell wall biosynthesis